jgi:hypothetical protein
MSKAKLPIGIQDFETIISDGYTYVDKTTLIYQLITQGKPYFLSRPRRFGKSLLVSTFDALFTGRRDLFKGLWIDSSDWNWIKYPVIRLDMSTINNSTPEKFELDLIRELNDIAGENNLSLSGVTATNYLENLIKKMSTKQKAVVLIDEYDRPLIDNIEDMELAKANQKILRQFYSILKAEDRYLQFIFMTGVTKFAKVSLFSGLNNLIDLSMLEQYSALLGYTREELERYFKNDIEDLATKRGLTLDTCYAQIKEWYNGYKFSYDGQWVYNPFSVLSLLNSKVFSPHWFETGTPSFLIDLIKKRQFDLSNLEQINVDGESFSTFDIEDLPTLPLLYQTGYLTIKSFLPQVNAFCLGFPNREVSQSFSKNLLTTFARSNAECSKLLVELSMNLSSTSWDYNQFFELIQQLFSLIPYDLYVKHERYFHSLFYLTVKFAGFQIGAEIHTQQGRTDAALEAKDKVLIFEFKFNENAQVAIDQIKQKKYYQFYQDRKLPIYLLGINFNGDKRAIDDWQVEQIR